MATSSCGNGHTSGNTGSGNRSITFSAGSAERRRATDSPTCSRKCRDGRDVRLSFATILRKNDLFDLLAHSMVKYVELNESFPSVVSSRDDITLFSQYYWPLVNSLQVMVLKVWTDRGFKESPEELTELFIKTAKGLGSIDYYHRVKSLSLPK